MSRSIRTSVAVLAAGLLGLAATGAQAASVIASNTLDDHLYQINITVPSAITGQVTFSAFAKSGATFGTISSLSVTGATGSLFPQGNIVTLRLNGLSAGTHTISVGSNSFAAPAYTLTTSLAASTYTVSQVPEAESGALALAGLGVVGLVMSRRRVAA